ncbi:hypothetical protein Vadar_010506 [Vaccinium darrowii]|uniref:Uncharacterized protein n=1 Tax=Vaccinium darrowii TaxID=229202 RepID=A0ACB7YVH5_9ERIC|nr:hypothetical protein Vadar_010506 [Vaccinium darrowii]
MDSSLVDRISQLPEPVKHHVMSFLPFRYRVRTSILSKTWQNAMASYPVLSCYESIFEEGAVTEEDPTKERERKLRFMNMVDNSILKLYKSGMTLNGFNLKLVFPEFDDQDFSLRVDNWLEILVSEIKVKELSIDFYGYYANSDKMSNRYRPHCILPQIVFGPKSLLTILELHNCTLEHLVFDASTKCESLREVSLVNVSLSEDILQKILLCCSSSLTEFVLVHCSGVKNIRLSGLNKLKKVMVMDGDKEILESIEIEAPSLCYFKFYGLRTTVRISLAACVNLQELHIQDPFCWEQFSDDIGSKYPLLKTLSIGNCGRLRRFEISSVQLERLTLHNAKHVTEAIIIQTPSLSSFEFRGNLSSISSFTTDTSRQCETRLLIDDFDHVTTLWFSQLKAFLTKFGFENKVLRVTSSIYSPKIADALAIRGGVFSECKTNADAASQSLLNYSRQPWKNAVIVKPIGYPIGYKSLYTKVKSVWDLQGDYSALEIGLGFVVFDMASDRTHVLTAGPWIINNQYITVREWEPRFKPDEAEEIKTAVWIRFPNFPLEYYYEKNIFRIARRLGWPIRADSTYRGNRQR